MAMNINTSGPEVLAKYLCADDVTALLKARSEKLLSWNDIKHIPGMSTMKANKLRHAGFSADRVMPITAISGKHVGKGANEKNPLGSDIVVKLGSKRKAATEGAISSSSQLHSSTTVTSASQPTKASHPLAPPAPLAPLASSPYLLHSNPRAHLPHTNSSSSSPSPHPAAATAATVATATATAAAVPEHTRGEAVTHLGKGRLYAFLGSSFALRISSVHQSMSGASVMLARLQHLLSRPSSADMGPLWCAELKNKVSAVAADVHCKLEELESLVSAEGALRLLDHTLREKPDTAVSAHLLSCVFALELSTLPARARPIHSASRTSSSSSSTSLSSNRGVRLRALPLPEPAALLSQKVGAIFTNRVSAHRLFVHVEALLELYRESLMDAVDPSRVLLRSEEQDAGRMSGDEDDDDDDNDDDCNDDEDDEDDNGDDDDVNDGSGEGEDDGDADADDDSDSFHVIGGGDNVEWDADDKRGANNVTGERGYNDRECKREAEGNRAASDKGEDNSDEFPLVQASKKHRLTPLPRSPSVADVVVDGLMTSPSTSFPPITSPTTTITSTTTPLSPASLLMPTSSSRGLVSPTPNRKRSFIHSPTSPFFSPSSSPSSSSSSSLSSSSSSSSLLPSPGMVLTEGHICLLETALLLGSVYLSSIAANNRVQTSHSTTPAAAAAAATATATAAAAAAAVTVASSSTSLSYTSPIPSLPSSPLPTPPTSSTPSPCQSQSDVSMSSSTSTSPSSACVQAAAHGEPSNGSDNSVSSNSVSSSSVSSSSSGGISSIVDLPEAVTIMRVAALLGNAHLLKLARHLKVECGLGQEEILSLLLQTMVLIKGTQGIVEVLRRTSSTSADE